MRHRITTTGEFVTDVVTGHRQHRTRPDRPWQNQVTYRGDHGKVQVKEVFDNPQPGFKACLESGLLPLRAFTVRSTTEERKILSDVRTQKFLKDGAPTGAETQWTGGAWDPLSLRKELIIPEYDEAILGSVVNSAIADAREAVWDTLTFIAELDATMSMFRSASDRLNEIVDKIARRTRRIRNRRKLLQEIAGLWLTYRYGVMPLLYDIEDSIKAFNAKNGDLIVKGRGYQSLSDNHPFDELLWDDGTARAYLRGNLRYECKYRGFALASVDYQKARFGFDPLVTAYEIATLSFVLDWFVDVGSYLQAVSPFAAGRDLSSCGSIRSTVDYVARVEIEPYTTDTQKGEGRYYGGELRFLEESYTRVPMGASLPGWNPRITWKRAFDALALAIGVRSRSRRHLRI